MQIRLTKPNAERLEQLVSLYRRICPDYDLSPTQQVNLLLGGRLKLALAEAQVEQVKKPCTKKCRK